MSPRLQVNVVLLVPGCAAIIIVISLWCNCRYNNALISYMDILLISLLFKPEESSGGNLTLVCDQELFEYSITNETYTDPLLSDMIILYFVMTVILQMTSIWPVCVGEAVKHTY